MSLARHSRSICRAMLCSLLCILPAVAAAQPAGDAPPPGEVRPPDGGDPGPAARPPVPGPVEGPSGATDDPGIPGEPGAAPGAAPRVRQVFPPDHKKAAPPAAAPAAGASLGKGGWPDKIGPFEISDKSGRFSLAVGIAAQLQLDVQGKESGGQWDDPTPKIHMRRIRPTLKGTALSKDLGVYFHLSTAPGSVEFMDFYLDYKFSDNLQLRLGQNKIPFTRYRIQSFKELTFNEWHLVTRYFGAERQMGLALHNGYEKPGRFEYEVGLYTGANARASHAVGLPALYGEKVGNPSNLLDPAPAVTFHPELVAHAAYNAGGIDTSTDTDWEGGDLGYSVGLSLTWDTRPQEFVDLSLRLAPEFLLKGHGFSFMALAYLGLVPPTGSDSAFDSQRLAMLGALLQASYLIKKRVELSVRYGMVAIDNNVRLDAQVRSRQLIAAAKDATEQKALQKQYGSAGTTEAEHESTLGVNVYIIGRSLKWRTDLSHKLIVADGGDRNEVLMRTQVQLAF